MNDVLISPTDESIQSLEKLYGRFDLDACGLPAKPWEGRVLCDYALDRRLRWYWGSEVWLTKIKVNRRMAPAIQAVLREINERWDPKQAAREGLDVFVRSYCFGCEPKPNPFWWGAGYRLSPEVSGVALEEAIKCFTRAGFTWAGATDKKAIRDFYYL